MLKKILLGLSAIGLIALLLGYFFYKQIFGPNLNPSKDPYALFIPRGSSFDDVFTTLKKDSALLSYGAFKQIANWMGYAKDNVPSGRYILSGDMSNYDIIGKLRIADQDPVRLTFNSARTYQELSGQLAKPLALDSLQIVAAMDRLVQDTTNDITSDNILTRFIPNTYMVYWDMTSDKLIKRLLDEHKKFWNAPSRREALKRIRFTPEEAYILASIVEKESNLAEERPVIAGVYLNRLRKGIKLQADPTVVFASGQFDLKRVLNKHLKINSPYNTYLHQGLPPGPIVMPSLGAIRAVLNPAKHNYLFFCAKPGYTGAHNFASTLREHNQNANSYRRWLNRQNIK